MKENNDDFIKRQLKPYRGKIDAIDDALLKLLGQRFDIVRQVAKVKIKHDIPSFLGGRVEEVKSRAAARGAKYGIDPEFLRMLYTIIIYQSCALEDTMKHESKQVGKAAQKPLKAASKTKKKSK